MFVGGLRALVLQALHPLAMAGVDQHSGYRGDPWGRLARTSRFLAVTTAHSSLAGTPSSAMQPDLGRCRLRELLRELR